MFKTLNPFFYEILSNFLVGPKNHSKNISKHFLIEMILKKAKPYEKI